LIQIVIFTEQRPAPRSIGRFHFTLRNFPPFALADYVRARFLNPGDSGSAAVEYLPIWPLVLQRGEPTQRNCYRRIQNAIPARRSTRYFSTGVPDIRTAITFASCIEAVKMGTGRSANALPERTEAHIALAILQEFGDAPWIGGQKRVSPTEGALRTRY